MIRSDDGWRLDLDHFDAAASAPDVTAVILCQPHNPCGMVMDADETALVIWLAERPNLVVIHEFCLLGGADALGDGESRLLVDDTQERVERQGADT